MIADKFCKTPWDVTRWHTIWGGNEYGSFQNDAPAFGSSLHSISGKDNTRSISYCFISLLPMMIKYNKKWWTIFFGGLSWLLYSYIYRILPSFPSWCLYEEHKTKALAISKYSIFLFVEEVMFGFGKDCY